MKEKNKILNLFLRYKCLKPWLSRVKIIFVTIIQAFSRVPLRNLLAWKFNPFQYWSWEYQTCNYVMANLCFTSVNLWDEFKHGIQLKNVALIYFRDVFTIRINL